MGHPADCVRLNINIGGLSWICYDWQLWPADNLGHFWGYFTNENERVRGIEPPCAAWEAAVLPLNYTRVWEK
jgi:hypothetical protein